jgi:hypothetical protein
MFNSGADTWLILTGPYRFERISNVGRRIKFRSEAQIPSYPFGLSDLSGPDDPDLTVTIRRRGCSPARVRVRSSPVRSAHWWSISGESPVSSGWRRDYDEDRHGEAVSRAWSAMTFASREGRGDRLEVQARRWCFGHRWGRRSAVVKMRERDQAGAPGREKKFRGIERVRHHLSAPDLRGNARRCWKLWWAISWRPADGFTGRQRGKREEGLGYLKEAWRGEGVRV